MEKKTTIPRDTLFLYFEGRLNEEEMTRIMDWVMESKENFDILKKERKLYDAIALADDRIFNGEAAKPARRSFMPHIWKAAAAVAIISAMALGWNLSRTGDNSATAMNTITVPAGERAMVTLSDGTAVWLNSGTTMQYPSRFGKKGEREVTVDGQVNLDVTHDSRHPFVVRTSVADIRVLGTRFDVNVSSDGKSLVTSLFEGSVRIDLPGGQDRTFTLNPGRKLTIADGKVSLREIDDYDVYRWTEGMYCFRDKRFSEILADFCKYFNQDIEYIPVPSLEKELLTGKFRISDGFDYAMGVLQSSLPFTYTKDQVTGKIYIRTK